MEKIDEREFPTVISDSSGLVRIGSLSPAFPPVRSKPANTDDTGKVRMGSLSPGLPRSRTK